VPRYGLLGQRLFKPTMHFVSNVLAVTKPVLHERNLVTGKQIQITSNSASDFLNRWTIAVQITAMPKDGCECVRVADQDPIRFARRGLLPLRLYLGGGVELFGSPVEIILC